MQKEIFKFSTREEYLQALDAVLPEKYEQTRKLGGNKTHTYLPTAIQEAVADDIFHYWNVEIISDPVVIINEVILKVKICFSPSYPDAGEFTVAGIAAQPIQQIKGSDASKFPTGKVLNALEYNLPSLKSRAVGNALESLGNIFGRNISRRLNQNESLPKNFTLRKHDSKEKEPAKKS